MQTGLAIIIGIAAFIYVINIFRKQLFQAEKNPKCDNCPVPEIINKNYIEINKKQNQKIINN